MQKQQKIKDFQQLEEFIGSFDYDLLQFEIDSGEFVFFCYDTGSYGCQKTAEFSAFQDK